MPTTTVGTFHSAATSTGNGSYIAVPSGDIVLLVSISGSGPIGAVIQPQVSADNSTWVDLQPSTRLSGAASVAQMVDVATTAAYIRVVLSEISGTNAAATVQLATYYPIVEATPTIDPSGANKFSWPVVAPNLLPQDPRSFATLGDSHLASWISTPVQYAPFGDQWNNHLWLQYWMISTGWRYFPLALLAVGGKRSDEILNEQLPALLALPKKPGFVIVSSGTNDGIQSISLATVVANNKRIYDTIIANGMGLRIYIAPIWTSSATVAKSQVMLQLREWTYDYAARNPGVIIYDHHALVQDGTYHMDYASAYACAKSTMLRDGIHTNHLSAFLAGKRFAALDSSKFGSDNALSSAYDSIIGISAGPATDDLRQLFRFPGLPGSTAEGNAGMSGVRPANGWYGLRYGTGSGVGSLTTVGNGWQRYDIAKAGAANGDSVVHGFGMVAADHAILAAPAWRRRLIQLSVIRRQASLSGVRADNINFGLTVNGVSRAMVCNANYGASAAVFPNSADRTLEFRTPTLEIPAGATVSGGSITVSTTFDAGGSCVDGIQEVRILDIARLYDGV